MNFLEQLPLVLIASAISGLRFPMESFYMLIGYCVARIAYNIGYTVSPNKRLIGALSMDLLVLAFIIMAYMALAKLL